MLLAEIIIKGLSKEQKIRAIQDRLISQYKKFLTKETGNGISKLTLPRFTKTNWRNYIINKSTRKIVNRLTRT